MNTGVVRVLKDGPMDRQRTHTLSADMAHGHLSCWPSRGAVLCCAVLCCAAGAPSVQVTVLCCAVQQVPQAFRLLCCAVLCCAVLQVPQALRLLHMITSITHPYAAEPGRPNTHPSPTVRVWSSLRPVTALGWSSLRPVTALGWSSLRSSLQSIGPRKRLRPLFVPPVYSPLLYSQAFPA